MSSVVIPKSDRVVFRQNPLVEVVAQVRFPDILKIQEALPADFQEHIRSVFPLYKERAEPVLVATDKQAPIRSRLRIYDFFSEDQNCSLSLCQNFLAMTVKVYANWKAFRTPLSQALYALHSVYKPTFYTRVGLRYVDLLDKDQLGLSNRPWSDLIRPSVCGVLADPEFANAIRDVNTMAEIDIGNATARLTSGTALEEATKRVAFVIDADIFTESKQEASVEPLLTLYDRFNAEAGNLFRWCIQPSLASALGRMDEG